MKKLNLLLIGAVLFSLVLVGSQQALADCGKMVIVYYPWPTPPPPPQRPFIFCGESYRPHRRPNVQFENNFANQAYQNAQRNAVNIGIQGNNNQVNVSIPEYARGRGNGATIQGWDPRDPSTVSSSSSDWLGSTYTGGESSSSSAGLDPSGVAYGPDNTFLEPNQQGVIAWNGIQDKERGEEILILTTNESSEIGAAMLSVLPLPGEPISIERANAQSFVAAKALMREKNKEASKNVSASSFGVFSETKIGSHNIFVWKVESSTDFQDKVQSYVAGKYGGKAAAVITENTVKVLNQYLKEGFEFFAFDLTLVEKDQATKEAIAYRFKSPYAYFPLRISQVGGMGGTHVDLVVLTPCEKLMFTARSGVKSNMPRMMFYGPYEFSSSDLDKIDESLKSVFNGSQRVLGRNFTFPAQIDSFNNDFEAVGVN